MAPGIGDSAPDIALRDGNTNETVRLSSYKGAKWVVLAFYPLAFTGG